MIRFIRNIWYRIKLKIILSALNNIDISMKKAGYKRHDRRRFWHNFIKRNKQEVFEILHKPR